MSAPLATLDRHGDAFAVAYQLAELLSAALSPRAVRVVDVGNSYDAELAIEGDDGEDWTLTVRSPAS